MKKAILTLILIFNISILMAQKKLIISYNYQLQHDVEQKTFEVTSTKNGSISTYKSGIKEGTTAIAPNGMEFRVAVQKNPDRVIFKNHKGGYLISQEIITGKNFYVKEPLNQMQWQLTGNTKTILKYKCQEATTTFRGRDYMAYFTTELPFKAAPFKFYGLPGIILQIQTTDQQINIEATGLIVQSSTKPLVDPFKDKKTLSWEDFVVVYKKKNKEYNDKHNMIIQQNIKWQKEAGVNTKATEERLKQNVSFESRLDIIVPGNDLSYTLKQIKKSLQNSN
jgi:GLPGLI family protein